MALSDLKRSHRQSARKRRRVVAVIGSGTTADPDACRQVGRLVAELGCDLLTGAGRGTMEAVAGAFCERRDELGSAALSIGIVPGEAAAGGAYSTKPGYPNPWVELAIYTHLPLLGNAGTDPLSRNHINVRAREELGRGLLEGREGTLLYLAQRGEVEFSAHEGRGLTSLILADCPQDRTLRLGIWFGPDPAAGAESEAASLAGTPADPAAIRDFMGHFRLCGPAEAPAAASDP